MNNIYITLFTAFAKMGAMSFGGGYVIISYILKVLDEHKWITEAEFGNLVALSNITPGPIAVNAATYVGYRVAGIGGSFVATFAIFLPSLIFMSIVAKFADKLRDNNYYISFMYGLRPATTAFLAAATISFIQSLFFTAIDATSILHRYTVLIDISKYVNPISIVIAIVSLILLKFKVNIIIMLLVTGLLGLLLF